MRVTERPNQGEFLPYAQCAMQKSLLQIVFVLFQWINCALMPLLDSYYLLKQILYNSAMTIGTTVSALAAAGAMMFL